MKSKYLSCFIPETLYDALKEKAAKKRANISRYVQWLIEKDLGMKTKLQAGCEHYKGTWRVCAKCEDRNEPQDE